MKHVLVLAYYFPPLGGAGVQRTVKFVKHLRELGYDVVVVTGPESTSVSWAPPDPTLAEELPPETIVLRIGTHPPPAGRRSRFARWLQRPSPFDRWWQEEARSLALTVAKDVDVVYASMSPFSTAAAAASVAHAVGKPWVADLRDPWALDDWSVYPSALHRRMELKRMRAVLIRADAIVMNTSEARKALLAAIPELAPRLVAVIPNGWDRDDFEAAPPSPRDDSSFRIVYAGYSHVASRVERRRRFVRVLFRGAAPGLVPYARSPMMLTQALARLGESAPELAARAELHVAGPGPAFGAPAEETVRVVHHGYLQHLAAISLMRSADLLFLPMHDLRPGLRCRTVTGKTYEYLAAGRPILAALPDGDARDLVSTLSGVWLCRPTDIDCMVDAIREAMLQEHEGRALAPDVLERFERRQLAVELVRVFDEVIAKLTAE